MARRLGVSVAFAVLAFAPSAFAASVTPTFVAGNPACSDYGFTGLSIDKSNVDGTYSSGTLTVTVVQSGGAGAPIDSWSSNIGVDMVIVKGGAGSGGQEGANVYRYDPPSDSFGDTDLRAPNNTGTSHVEFCYDKNSGPPPPPPAPPTCQDTSATTSPGTSVDMSLPCSGTGSNLTCSIVSMPSGGTLGDVNGCAVSYTPNSGTCQDTFTYEATDSNGTSNVATATVTVTPCGPPPPAGPTCQDTSATTAPGTAVDMSLPCSGTGDHLSCSIVGMPQNGTLGAVNGCQVTYTPNSGVCGQTDSFTYQSTDSNGTSNVATGTITMTACSTPPPASTDQPAQQEAPAQQQAPAEQPGGQLVLGERISSPSAKLLAASGCSGKPFAARVRGANIARVVFFLDGNRVAVLTKPTAKGLYSIRINPARYRVGVHRIKVVVTFNSASRTAPRTLRASFQRCASRLIAPRFTG